MNEHRLRDMFARVAEACKKYEYVFLCCIFAFAASVCFYCLPTNPVSWFDEGIYHQIVTNMTSHGFSGLQLSPGNNYGMALISVGYPVFYPAVAAFKMFGDSIVILRLVAIAFIFGFLFAFYALGRELYGRRAALVGTALLATFSPLYGDGKNFLGEVPGLFYLTAGLWCLARMERSGRKSFFAIFAGLLIGFAAASKPLYLLILPAMFVGAIWHAKTYFGTSEGRKIMGLFFVGLVPALVAWYATQFGITSSLSHVLAHYSNPNDVSTTASSVLVNLRRFITESTPIHFFVLFALAVAALWPPRGKRRLPEIILVTFSFLVFFSYVRTIGWYRYLFPGQALLFLFFVPGVERLVRAVPRVRAYAPSTALGCAVLLLAAQGVVMRQERFICKMDAPTAIAPLFKEIQSHESVLFYNLPQLVARYPWMNYSQWIRMHDHFTIGVDAQAGLDQGAYDWVFISENSGIFHLDIPTCYMPIQKTFGVDVYRRMNGRDCSKTESK